MKRRSLIVFAGDPPEDSGSVFVGPLLVGVVFFPSLPFMGVMLFPSFVLGNASGEGGTFLVPLSLFSILLSLPLLYSLSPSPSFSLLSFLLFFHIPFSLFPFLSHKLFPSLFSSPPLFHLFFLLLLFFISFSFPLSLLRVFFFFEGTACTVYFRNVLDNTTDCN